MWKAFAVLVTALVLSLPATAQPQQQPQQQQQQRVPAPDLHAATGLAFPPQLGEFARNMSIDYGKSMNRPELGYSWNYRFQDKLSGTAYVYMAGNTTIPSGAGNPLVIAQFEQSYSEIKAANRYENLTVTKPAADCRYGGVVLRCMTISGLESGSKRPVSASLLVTGYRNHLVKLRVDWEPGSAGDAVADRFVSAVAAKLR